MNPSVPEFQKPKHQGGSLIRRAISTLRISSIQLPMDSNLLIACSGGPDSVALAHLLIHYGRRIVSKDRITLLHINHGWRAEASHRDEEVVKKLANSWGVEWIAHHLTPPTCEAKASWEDLARAERKRIYQSLAEKRNALVLTAHHGDDLAETLLWRLFTGASLTHGEGILVKTGVELRPFLAIRKKQILSYLEEESLEYCLDSTNDSGRFLRARMRKGLIPEIEVLFPKAINHLIELSLKNQANPKDITETQQLAFDFLFQTAGIKVRRPHYQFLEKASQNNLVLPIEVHLPGGWKLARRAKKSSSILKKDAQTWILEKIDNSGL